MQMLPHFVDVLAAPDGPVTVEVTFDLSPTQAGAFGHAMRVTRDERYRVTELSADDVLAMRDMTALADELSDLQSLGVHAHVRASVARLGVLRSALEQFASAEHQEREGDAEARPVVFELVDAVADLHAEALHAALTGAAAVS